MSVQLVLQYIVEKHRNGRESRIKEMASEMQITKKECVNSIQMANEQIKEVGLVIVPGCKERVDARGSVISKESVGVEYTHVLSSFEKCEFVHMCKTLECTREDNNKVNEHVYEISYIVMVVILNGMDIEYERVVDALRKIHRTEAVLKKAVAEKYVKKYKRNETEYVRVGWRFYFEYPGFTPEKYIECIQKKKVDTRENECSREE